MEDSLSSLHIMSLQGMWNILTDNHNDGDDGVDQLRRATTPSSTGQMELDPLRAEPSLPIPLILCCSVTQLQPTNQPTKQPAWPKLDTNKFLVTELISVAVLGFNPGVSHFYPPSLYIIQELFCDEAAEIEEKYLLLRNLCASLWRAGL